jgi:hypothetical protein
MAWASPKGAPTQRPPHPQLHPLRRGSQACERLRSGRVYMAGRGERLESQRAAPGERVQDVAVSQSRAEQRTQRGEQRLAHPVRGGPRALSLRRLETSSSELPSYDSHPLLTHSQASVKVRRTCLSSGACTGCLK